MPRSRIFIFIPPAPSHVRPGHAGCRRGCAVQHPGRQRRRQPDFSGQHRLHRRVPGATNITAVLLEYGVNQLTCGTVDAKAFPQVTPGTDVKVTWTWQMLQSGTLAPGSTVWWHWQVTDSSGAQFNSPTKTVLLA